jgi:hypothetical protein
MRVNPVLKQAINKVNLLCDQAAQELSKKKVNVDNVMKFIAIAGANIAPFFIPDYRPSKEI